MKLSHDLESVFDEIVNADGYCPDDARGHLATICAVIKGYGVEGVTACYAGSYNSGDVDCIFCKPEDTGLPEELRELVEIWVLSVLPESWDWDAGSRGHVTIDVASSRAHVEHAWYVVDTVKSYDIE